RINVFTGEKELLLRREGDYYTGLSTVVKIDILGDKKLISLDGNAYIMEGESADWQEIPGIYEAEWINDNEIIGIEEETGNIVRYNIINSNIDDSYYTLNDGRNFISCNSSGSVCLISEDYKKFIILEDGNVKTIYNSRIDTIINNNDSICIPYWYYKPFCINTTERIIITNGYINGKPSDYLIILDSLNSLKKSIIIKSTNYVPRADMEYAIASDSTREEVLLYNSNNEIIKSIKFPLDKLD
ncbi:MAG: hypothetical protein R6U31_01615, partial [bacterium]